MGLFVTFEGVDGSGKTTITQYIYDYLKKHGYPVMMTREPGGNEIAEKIRTIILDPANKTMDDRTEALLYAASRRQHLVEKVLPALEKGQTVICDRFVDSSIAYQGYGREIGPEAVLDINLFAIENHLPDMTFFLDIDPEKGMNRVFGRGESDRLELSGKEFFARVYQGYQHIIDENKTRIIVVDADRTVEEIAHEIIDCITKRLD